MTEGTGIIYRTDISFDNKKSVFKKHFFFFLKYQKNLCTCIALNGRGNRTTTTAVGCRKLKAYELWCYVEDKVDGRSNHVYWR